jgi:membrane-bound lytic murein transglycosylase A
LYSMQVQGSGKARLPDGEVVRLAYAEQNGHPFIPPVQARVRKTGSRPALLTRGIELPQETVADDSASADAPRRSAGAPGAAKGADENLSPEVERMVELLLKGNTDPQPIPATSTTSSSSYSSTSSSKATRPAPAAGKTAPLNAGEGGPPKAAVAGSAAMFSSDPSYIFFRQIPDSESGPIGALGVPLTPGRSVAVDPRTTPLGFPVFISTEGQGIGTRLNRLVLAQDTGGAIRGPVRADYFWGFGPGAGELASRMKENGRMWLLLPKDLQLRTGAEFNTRGIRGATAGDELECLVPDPELCVE